MALGNGSLRCFTVEGKDVKPGFRLDSMGTNHPILSLGKVSTAHALNWRLRDVLSSKLCPFIVSHWMRVGQFFVCLQHLPVASDPHNQYAILLSYRLVSELRGVE